jgi:Zn finger protein HypA/HybF involved in hydrogenase expression
MHDGCGGCFDNGKQVADKVRMMGFDQSMVPAPLDIACSHCGNAFNMETMVSACPVCNMVYAVTPCHCTHADHAMAAGIGY